MTAPNPLPVCPACKVAAGVVYAGGVVECLACGARLPALGPPPRGSGARCAERGEEGEERR